MRARFALFLAAGLGAAAAGCEPTYTVEFEPRTEVPLGDSLRDREIVITEGRAIGVTAAPMDGDERMDHDTHVTFVNENPSVAEIESDGDHWAFVLFGARPGQTSFRLVVDGTDQISIPVNVVEAK